MTAIRGRQATVMVVEDHALVRSAICEAIDSDEMHVIDEVATGEEALARAPVTRPDLLLVDIDLPGLSGLDVVRELAPRLPDTIIVMLTVSSAIADAVTAISAGAAGYLTKDMSPEALRRALRSALAGDLAMPRRLAGQTMRQLSGRHEEPAAAVGRIGPLSRREREVLRLLAEGLTDRQIAETLTISIRTVESHVAAILRKLDVRNRAAAARLYLQGERSTR